LLENYIPVLEAGHMKYLISVMIMVKELEGELIKCGQQAGL
jgi:hypothetical protein